MYNLKRVLGTAALGCAAIACLSVQQTIAAEDTRAVVISTEDVPLREGTKTVGTVTHIVVRILDTQDNWAYVRTFEGKKGWIPRNQVVRLDQAEAYFADRIRQNPSDAYAYYLRAVARYELGQTDQALSDINRYIESDPESAMAYNWRGILWDTKGQYDRALADYNQAIRIGPAHAFYYENAARARLAKKEYAQAVANFDEALRRDPELSSAYFGRAKARAFKGGNPIGAIEDFGKARRLAPDEYGDEGMWFGDDDEAYARAQADLAKEPDSRIAQFHPQDSHEYAARGGAWLEKGDFAKAAADFGEAMRLEPKAEDWPRYRGWAMYEMGRFPAGLADYNTAIGIAPKWGEIYNERGVIRLRQGDSAGALDDFNRAIEFDEFDALAKLNRGWVHFLQKNYALAAADFVDAFPGVRDQLKFHQGWSDLGKPVGETMAFDPLDAYLLSFRGRVRMQQGDPSGALADFQAAENLDSRLPLPSYYRGQMLLEKGDKEKAIGEFTEAIDRCKDFAWAYYSRGLTHGELKQHAQAVADFSSAIDQGMKTGAVYNARGWNLEQEGDLDRAAADYNEAARLEPKGAYIFNNRGWLAVRQKDYTRAIADFNKALELFPKWSWPLNNRGVAHKNLRQYREAMIDYRAAIAADAKNAAAHSNLAWVLATCPDTSLRDGKEAVELALKACELGDWKAAASLESLAAAYAEKGDFEQALRWQTKALELADEADKDVYRQRLTHYEGKKAWREP